MRITILGAGEVGINLGVALIGDGHEVCLIDSDSEAVQRARDELDVQVIEGHGGSVDVLEQAGVVHADLFCAVTFNDELNMLASLLAKKLGSKLTAVRVRGLSHVTRKRFFYRKTLDFDLTISPEEMTATAISRIVRGQDLVDVESIAEGKVQMQRFELTGRFAAAGKKIREIKMPRNSLIVALIRDTSIMIPQGEDEVCAGDEVVIIGATETIERVDKILGGRINLPKRVMIVGGGRAGVAAARTLANLKIKVKILERSMARCEELSEILPHATIEHADGANLQHLLEEGAARQDIFLSLTDNDEVNLIAAQLAREVGSARTIAQVWKRDYHNLYKKLNIDEIISPRMLIAERILKFVRSDGSSRVTSIEQGRAEVLEFEVGEESPLAGLRICDTNFPRGALIGAIIRGEEVLVPRGDDVLEAGDNLVVFALSQVRRKIEAAIS